MLGEGVIVRLGVATLLRKTKARTLDLDLQRWLTHMYKPLVTNRQTVGVTTVTCGQEPFCQYVYQFFLAGGWKAHIEQHIM